MRSTFKKKIVVSLENSSSSFVKVRRKQFKKNYLRLENTSVIGKNVDADLTYD